MICMFVFNYSILMVYGQKATGQKASRIFSEILLPNEVHIF